MQANTITGSAPYNANGTRATSTDFNGHITTYGYVGVGSLTKVTPPTNQLRPFKTA